jgi:ADP-ribose pyrophosphatase YjhB (NUDIX family)
MVSNGGFIGNEESSDQAVSRVLYTLTGLENIYLEQLNSKLIVNQPQESYLSHINSSVLRKISKSMKSIKQNGLISMTTGIDI